MNQYFDENEIRKTVEILKPDGELFEIRVLLPGKRNLSGYFRDADTVIDELGKVNMREANVFITLQGVKGACYDRKQKDKLHAKPEVTTSDNDIEAYEWLLILTQKERESPAHQAQTQSSKRQRHSLRR